MRLTPLEQKENINRKLFQAQHAAGMKSHAVSSRAAAFSFALGNRCDWQSRARFLDHDPIQLNRIMV